MILPGEPPIPATAKMNGHTNMDHVAVSGISCRLPDADNMAELRQHLFDGKDMVTECSRWDSDRYGIPKRCGTIKDITKFDAAFFGVHTKQAERMDPQLRILLEVAYESLIDAGVDPNAIRGSRTGVFVGNCGSEAHLSWTTDPDTVEAYGMTGCAGTMLANRLSFFFDFKGPSMVMDTACSSGLLALDQALLSIRTGRCDAAIVAGANILLRPTIGMEFQKLGMLSPEGMCKSFDDNGNGYCRSEGIVAIYLQKRAEAKRVYCTVLHCKSNADGHKDEGVTFPFGDMQKQLLQEVCDEAGVDPTDIVYMEAHGTGTKAGDPQEAGAIADLLCANRKKPLLIGSIKSNLGHTEGVSGLASMAKVLIAMEDGYIPANIHYYNPNQDIRALTDGRLKVVTEKTKLEDGIIGLSSFGFGGSNVFALLQPPVQDKRVRFVEDSLRLFTYGWRTEEGLNNILNAAMENSNNLEFLSLLTETSRLPVSQHQYRGYAILNSELKTSIQKCSSEGRPVWYVFSGMGSQWRGMGRELMELEVFSESIEQSDRYLQPHDVHLCDLIMDSDEKAFDNVTHAFVGIIAVQIAMVDVLTDMGVSPDGFVGHSVGELGCAYADGALTAEETLLTAYWRGRCIEENRQPGAMAVVGMSWEEVKSQCHEGVVAACYNSEELVTVSGNNEAVARFVKDVRDKGIFCKEVQSAGVAFHSSHMREVAPVLKAALDKVIVTKPRSSRWVSTSIPKSEWESDLAKFSSADYHVHNLVSPVLFHDALQNIPRNAILIEISPHCLLQSILKSSMGHEALCVGLMHKKSDDNINMFLTSLGQCYMAGMNFCSEFRETLSKYPISKGTPMISPLLKWDHSRSWDIPDGNIARSSNGKQNNMEFEVDLSPSSHSQYLRGHSIDGHLLLPVTAHLVMVWKTLAKMTDQEYEAMSVVWQDVHIHRASFVPASGGIKFSVRIMDGSGYFEVYETGTLVVSGRIFAAEDGMEKTSETFTANDVTYELNADDIYKELRIRGYDYDQDFKGILRSTQSCERSEVLWTGNWVTHLDTLLQIYVLSQFKETVLRLPSRFKYISIQPEKHTSQLYQKSDGNKAIAVSVNNNTKTVMTGGVVIIDPHTVVTERRLPLAPTVQTHHFVSYGKNVDNFSDSLIKYADICSTQSAKVLRLWNEKEKRTNGNSHLFLHLDQIALSDVVNLDDVDALCDRNDCGLLSTIKDLEKGEQWENSHISHSLRDDILLTSLHQMETLKPLLDIVTDNVAHDRVRILELEASRSGIQTKVKGLMSLRSDFSVQYTVADTTMENIDVEKLNASGIDTLEWNPTRPPPPSLKNMKLVIALNALHTYHDLPAVMKNISSTMQDGAFLLVQEVTRNFHIHFPVELMSSEGRTWTRQSKRTWAMYYDEEKWGNLFETENFEVITKQSDGLLSTIFLLRRRSNSSPDEQTLLDIGNFDYNWVDLLKEHVEKIQLQPNTSKLWLVAENTASSGIIGLVNCLRYEPGGDKIRCIFNASLNAGGDFHITRESEVFKELVKKDLTMNIYRDGDCFGFFTYSPLSNTAVERVPCKHAFVNISKKGDLSTLQWFESPLQYHTVNQRPDMVLCTVNYASLNFRDIMLATGKLPADTLPRNLATHECILGMEFSGVDQRGRRVAGIVEAQALASTVLLENRFLIEVPDDWSMDEAATVPIAYATAYYSLVVRGNIRKGDKILIHAGSGAVGQAAITVALDYGCEIFTTVGTIEKREYLLSKFPQLQNDHIGNSRNTTFEAEVLNLTDGRGVDVVLNSLADDKLEASLRVLAEHGRFLEIGKYDMSKNTSLGMAIFLKNISFHGILLDALFGEDERDWERVSTLLRDGMRSGVVKPLRHTTFQKQDLESAFRFMARGHHIGKVLIQVTEEGESVQPNLDSKILAIPKTYFPASKSYIITGGLGGFGLELVYWMISRGARNFLLTSRSGVKTGYQAKKLKRLRERGATVEISMMNISDIDDTKQLFEDALKLGHVGGVFHLAGVLEIALLTNQSAAQFKTACDPKIKGVQNLDQASREQCSESLDWFVVFSSYIVGHGVAGQTNYGFANSAMERICEKRRSEGLSALAIQWGAVGDVGMAVNTSGSDNFEVAGTLPQRMYSCLAELDRLLKQPHPIAACYVKTDISTRLNKISENKREVVERVLNIIGIQDRNSINATTKFGDLGLDSLLGVEVQQTLDNDYGLALSLREFRQLTPLGLEEMARQRATDKETTRSD